MEIEQMLCLEHSKAQTLKIVRYIGKDSKRFAKLMELFFGKNKLVNQRAAWVVRHCAAAEPNLFLPWLKRMILNLDKPDLHVAVKRNTLVVLSEFEIPESLQGRCVEICFRLLRSKEEAIAVKVFSMTVIFNICKAHPELKNELKLAVKDLMEFGGPAVNARGRKVLSQLEKL